MSGRVTAPRTLRLCCDRLYQHTQQQPAAQNSQHQQLRPRFAWIRGKHKADFYTELCILNKEPKSPAVPITWRHGWCSWKVVPSGAFQRTALGLVLLPTHLLPRPVVLSGARQATEKPEKTPEEMGREGGSGWNIHLLNEGQNNCHVIGSSLCKVHGWHTVKYMSPNPWFFNNILRTKLSS